MPGLPTAVQDAAFVVYPVKDVRLPAPFTKESSPKETANWQDQWVEYDIGSGTLAIGLR
jgi:hypothetical protein